MDGGFPVHCSFFLLDIYIYIIFAYVYVQYNTRASLHLGLDYARNPIRNTFDFSVTMMRLVLVLLLIRMNNYQATLPLCRYCIYTCTIPFQSLAPSPQGIYVCSSPPIRNPQLPVVNLVQSKCQMTKKSELCEQTS